MDDGARVVLAVEAPRVAEEVLHYLDRSGLARVVATATDDRQLADAARQLEPDVVIAQPSLAGVVREIPVLAVDSRETVAGLRAALHGGARGFFVWPDDRERLLGSVARSMAGAAAGTSGLVVAVRGVRGGAGATFACAHLGAAFVRAGRTCVLVDGDPLQGDLTMVLGAPLGGDLSIEHTDEPEEQARDDQPIEALWSHQAGFRVVLAEAPEIRMAGGAFGSVVVSAARTADVVLVHLPRTLDEPSLAALGNADALIHVLTLDAVSFRAAHRALEALSPLRLGARSMFLVNRAARSEIAPGDVQRVFGNDPIAVIPMDRAVARAMASGRLLGPRHRIGRAFDRAAARIVESSGEAAA